MTPTVQDRIHGLDHPLALVERWRLELGGGQYEDGLDQASVEIVGLVRDFGLDDLRSLSLEGHRAALEISGGAWMARVHVEPGARFVIDEMAGPPDEAFPDERTIAQVQSARDGGRTEDLLRLCADLECHARLTIQVHAGDSGFHWFRTTDAITRHIGQHTWLGLISGLFSTASPHRLVVQDAEGDVLIAKDIVVHGPEGSPPDPPGSDESTSREYSETWLGDDRSRLPTPVGVFPRQVHGMPQIASMFLSIAHGLSWVWLASAATARPDAVALRFEGVPDLEFDVTQLLAPDNAAEAVRLWEWCVASTDPARREAFQQAVSLVVREPAFLQQAGERVLRTAKYLLRLAKQGSMAEALAARRAARQAAIDAARASADTSRSASRAVVDRVLTQLVGGFGLLLANQAGLINATVAGWLLVALFGLTMATAVVAFAFEYPAARASLEAFEEDLEGYSDTLIAEDISYVKGMKTVAVARTQLSRARWISAAFLVVAAVALVVVRLLI